MLLGNFCAIASSAVFAMYALSSSPILKGESLPFSLYLGIISVYTILISIAAAWLMGTPVAVFSVDPVNGVFGMFAAP